MPLENAKLIPTVCPNCGSDLQIPEDLTKAHCLYCGAEFIISEKKADVHYHMGEHVGTIENYIDLAISSIQSRDMTSGKTYIQKAKEIDLKKAEAEIDKRSKEMVMAYLACAKIENQILLTKEPVMNYGIDTFDIASSSVKTMSLSARLALSNAEGFLHSPSISEKEKKKLMGYYYIEGGKYILGEAYLWKYHYDMSEACKKDAISNFKKALEFIPNNEEAIKYLKQLGVKCSTCKGTGKCASCGGTGVCVVCHGKGVCSKCGGTGIVTGFFGKEKNCKLCDGSGICPSCGGNKVCSKCNNQKICPNCHGVGL